MHSHHTKHLSSVLAVLLGFALVCGVTTITPATSHAIPVAGDYTFTSGFTGTFTSNGNALTVWSFSVPSTIVLWTDSDPSVRPATNGNTIFFAATQAGDVRIDWSNTSFTARLNLTAGGIGSFDREGFGNSDSVISGSLASPTPPEGGDTKERGNETHETESRSHL